MALGKASTGALIAVSAIGLLFTMITAGALTSTQTVPFSGTIAGINVGVYTDSACTVNCTGLSWGTLSPGGSATKTVYIKNTGTIPETLSMAVINWVPSNANTYLTLTWDRPSYVLAAGSSVSATFTLTASASAGAITSFNANIVVTGTE